MFGKKKRAQTPYDDGYHSCLYPADQRPAKPGTEAEWQRGYDAAFEWLRKPPNPTVRPILLEDGTLDAFIVGSDGIPLARLEHPVATGEEVIVLAREYLAMLEAESEQDESV